MKRTLTITEVADIFGIARQTVDNWVDYGVLRKVKIGDKSYISGATVQRLIDRFDDAGNTENRILHLERELSELETKLRSEKERLGNCLMFYSDSAAYGLAKTLKILFNILAVNGEYTQRNTEIVTAILEGGSAEVIANKYGYTTERIRQIARDAFARLERSTRYAELIEENDRLEERIKELEMEKEIIQPDTIVNNPAIATKKDIPADLLRVLNMNIDDSNLSVRAKGVCRSDGIKRMYDLVKRTEYELSIIRNSGLKTVNEIRDYVERNGLRFGIGTITDDVICEWERNQ